MGASGAGVSWTASPILSVIGTVLLATIIVSLLILLISIKKRKLQLRVEIQEKIQNKNILFTDKSANFFGQESKGYKQIRGNGVLVITDDSLMFFMLLPRKEIIIELSKIESIESPASFLGKSVLKPLLKVDFTNENGEKDSAAWYLRNLEEAKRILKDKIIS